MVRMFFDCCDKMKPSMETEIEELSASRDIIRDVFRHSSCVALELQSVPAYPQYENFYKVYANMVRSEMPMLLRKSEAYRQGLLQAGVHMIVFSTREG